jgi:hypothetical protein
MDEVLALVVYDKQCSRRKHMIDPTTASAVISGLVSILTAYMTYRVGMKQAEQQGKTGQATDAPTKPEAPIVEQAEAALPVVREGVRQHGDQREQTALANFEDDPEMYGPVLERVLTGIASRQPEFLHQLQTAAQQANVQGRGVNISGNVYGNVMDLNTGSITSTYNFGNGDDK